MAQVPYRHRRQAPTLPRLPLSGSLDLTYRCNNNCRHCWLRLAPNAKAKQEELSFDEIIGIIGEARRLGCRQWSLSGGEPMLRPDFAELFDFITAKAVAYDLNTNGTLITPAIARLLKRRGRKMVALYGADSRVHDHITRTPGSFEAALQGLAYLKEAGAGFIVQLIPMRDNYHQFNAMVGLAQSLSPHYRIGASWLFLSACGSRRRNAEIARQRLAPEEVIRLDQPDLSYESWLAEGQETPCQTPVTDDCLLASCIAKRREFHVDPYGGMTFCGFIKDPALRYDLRRGTFREAWEEFIPSLTERVRGGREYLENCAVCELRRDCRWCDAYGYLEHRRHGAKIEYLCRVAQANRDFKENWQKQHRRYYEIAGLTVQVEADLPLTGHTFADKFGLFEAAAPGLDTVQIRHQFSLPQLSGKNLGQAVYRRPPWAIYHHNGAWIYLELDFTEANPQPYLVGVFNGDHTRGRIYHNGPEPFLRGGHQSLTLFPTDQILLARVLADRAGCFLHASGLILNGEGLLFTGHSGAGKSTIARMLMGRATLLCDDRIIIRRWPDGFQMHGTWSHGEIPRVSPDSAPLKAVLFLEKSARNRLVPLKDSQEISARLLACLIKPLATAQWWDKTLALIAQVVREVPCYRMEFDLSEGILAELAALVEKAP